MDLCIESWPSCVAKTLTLDTTRKLRTGIAQIVVCWARCPA